MLIAMEKNEIEKKVEEILKDFSFDDRVDIIEVAESAGFTVAQGKLKECEDGFLMIDLNAEKLMGIRTSKLIAVNVDRDYDDKRFIIAHELGHYYLQFEKSHENVFAHRENKKGKDEEENEVDYFAACILMPENTFKKKHEEISNNSSNRLRVAEKLSVIFGAPFASVRRRIAEIKLED